MATIADNLVDTSLGAMLSAIEIYNEPDFKYREQMFTVLVVNAYELLLKARILQSSGDDISKLYATKTDGSLKRNRNGEPLTIVITRAMTVVALDDIVQSNVRSLIDIRDTAVHLYHSDPISYVVYTLGVAALKNYQKLMKDWLGRSLLEYNVYILPIGFAYSFLRISMLELDKGPEAVANLVRSISATQASLTEPSDFDFVCEIGVQMRAAQHFPSGADLSVGLATTGTATEEALIVQRVVRPIDQYPYSYTELRQRVKRAVPNVKQSVIDDVIRKHHIKTDTRMSIYSFPTRRHALEYDKNGTLRGVVTSLYNDEAVRFIIEHVKH